MTTADEVLDRIFKAQEWATQQMEENTGAAQTAGGDNSLEGRLAVAYAAIGMVLGKITNPT